MGYAPGSPHLTTPLITPSSAASSGTVPTQTYGTSPKVSIPISPSTHHSIFVKENKPHMLLNLWDYFVILMHLIGTTYLTGLISFGGTISARSYSLDKDPKDFTYNEAVTTTIIAGLLIVPTVLVTTHFNIGILSSAQIQGSIKEIKKYHQYANSIPEYQSKWRAAIGATMSIAFLAGLLNTYMVILPAFRSYSAINGMFGSASRANQDIPGIVLATMPILVFMALYTGGNMFWMGEAGLNILSRFLMPNLDIATRLNIKRLKSSIEDVKLSSQISSSEQLLKHSRSIFQFVETRAKTILTPIAEESGFESSPSFTSLPPITRHTRTASAVSTALDGTPQQDLLKAFRGAFKIRFDSGAKEFSVCIGGMTAIMIYGNIILGLAAAANDTTLGFFQTLLRYSGCHYPYITGLLNLFLLIACFNNAKMGVEHTTMLARNIPKAKAEHKGLAIAHLTLSLMTAGATIGYPWMIGGNSAIITNPAQILPPLNGILANIKGASLLLAPYLYRIIYEDRLKLCFSLPERQEFKDAMVQLHIQFEKVCQKILEMADSFGFDSQNNDQQSAEILNEIKTSLLFDNFKRAYDKALELYNKKAAAKNIATTIMPFKTSASVDTKREDTIFLHNP